MSINVLIVDDSAFFRKRLLEILSAVPSINVIGGASNGREAIEAVNRLNPDVITMDYEMPVMDGVTAVREIMRENPRPILMFSSLTYEGARVTLDALEAGAVDFLPKTFADVSGDVAGIRAELAERIKTIYESHAPSKSCGHVSETLSSRETPQDSEDIADRAATHSQKTPNRLSERRPDRPLDQMRESKLAHPVEAVVIGSSTGGPIAIQKVLMSLPSDFSLPILIVQHMPASFTRPFAERLNSICDIHVREAAEGDRPEPGVAYLAPGAKQMVLNNRTGQLRLNIIEGDHGLTYKPSVDVTFGSSAKACSGKLLGIVLTGMGSDGREGCRLIKQHGGSVWTQTQESCVIYGMPAAVDKAGYSDLSIGIDQLADKLLRGIG